ncbi:hypothetical protein EVB79_001 [Rhizobium phage RHph_N3_13]|nr:hypothetical protein EVB79_001 [Rhizobium phage RHph_N3_13]QIG69828.1 hypothetical protein F67_I3_11_002 [Rhizobium phage RHph_I3_11]
MAKYNLITDAAELAKTGKELAQGIRDQDERIAVYLLSEVAHIEVHRNPTRLNQFFSRIKGSGARINAMHNFIQVFANVTLNKEANSAIKADGSLNDNNKFGRKDESGEVFAWYYSVNKKERFQKKPEELQSKIIAKAEEKPWFSFQPERPAVQFDADNKVKALLKSLWSVALKGDVKISKDLLNGLTEVAFKAGVIETAADILPADTVAKVPTEYKAALHLVVDNTSEKTEETKGPAKPKSSEKRTAANAH